MRIVKFAFPIISGCAIQFAYAANIEIGGNLVISDNVAEHVSTGFGGSGQMSPLGPGVENRPRVVVQSISAENGASISIDKDAIIKGNKASDIHGRSGGICLQAACASR